MIPPLLHIGYHKTGTTTLQRHLFAHPEFGFKPISLSREDLLELFVNCGPYRYDAGKARSLLEEQRIEAERAGLSLAVSHERFCGYPATGGYDAFAIADRLKAAMPKVNVVIVVREQIRAMASMYKQYIHDGGVLSARQYFGPRPVRAVRAPRFDPAYYRYIELIRYYDSLFGRQHVTVLPFEYLRKNPETFLASIPGVNMPRGTLAEGFSGKENQSRTPATMFMRRFTNRWFAEGDINPGGVLNFPMLGKFISKSLDPLLRPYMQVVSEKYDRALHGLLDERFGGCFKKSNQELVERSGFALDRLGYQC